MALPVFPSNPQLNQKVSTQHGSWAWNGTFWATISHGTSSTRTTHSFAPGQTTIALTYPIGGLEVFRNGVLQNIPGDVTAANGTSFIFAKPLSGSDIVETRVLGVISTLDAVRKDGALADLDDKVAARSNLGLLWRKLDDQIVTGANASQIVMSLQGCRSVRLRWELFLPASVPAANLLVQTSTDGVTFATAAADYRSSSVYSQGSSVGAFSTDNPGCQITATWQANQSTEIVIPGHAEIFAGLPNKRFSLIAKSLGIGSDEVPMVPGGRRKVAGAQSHIRIVPSVTGALIGVGSRFTLEGC